MQNKLMKEYNEKGILIKEYEKNIFEIGNSFAITLPIDFVKRFNLKKKNKLEVIDKYDFLIVQKKEE